MRFIFRKNKIQLQDKTPQELATIIKINPVLSNVSIAAMQELIKRLENHQIKKGQG